MLARFVANLPLDTRQIAQLAHDERLRRVMAERKDLTCQQWRQLWHTPSRPKVRMSALLVGRLTDLTHTCGGDCRTSIVSELFDAGEKRVGVLVPLVEDGLLSESRFDQLQAAGWHQSEPLRHAAAEKVADQPDRLAQLGVFDALSPKTQCRMSRRFINALDEGGDRAAAFVEHAPDLWAQVFGDTSPVGAVPDDPADIAYDLFVAGWGQEIDVRVRRRARPPISARVNAWLDACMTFADEQDRDEAADIDAGWSWPFAHSTPSDLAKWLLESGGDVDVVDERFVRAADQFGQRARGSVKLLLHKLATKPTRSPQITAALSNLSQLMIRKELLDLPTLPAEFAELSADQVDDASPWVHVADEDTDLEEVALVAITGLAQNPNVDGAARVQLAELVEQLWDARHNTPVYRRPGFVRAARHLAEELTDRNLIGPSGQLVDCYPGPRMCREPGCPRCGAQLDDPSAFAGLTVIGFLSNLSNLPDVAARLSRLLGTSDDAWELLGKMAAQSPEMPLGDLVSAIAAVGIIDTDADTPNGDPGAADTAAGGVIDVDDGSTSTTSDTADDELRDVA